MLSVSELSSRLGISERAVRMRIERGDFPGAVRVRSEGAGRVWRWEVPAAADAPGNLATKGTQGTKLRTGTDGTVPAGTPALPGAVLPAGLEDSLRLMVGAMRVTEGERAALLELGMRRLGLVIDFAAGARDGIYDQWQSSSDDTPGSYALFSRVLKAVRNGDAGALLGRYRPRVEQRVSTLLGGDAEAELRRVLGAMILELPSTACVASIHRLLVARSEQQGWPVPSPSWTRREVAKFRCDETLNTYLEKGVKGVRAQAGYISQDRSQVMPGDIYVSDHRVSDVEVIGPDGKLIRPWMTFVVDARTMVPVSFAVLTNTPNADSVIAVLAAAMLPFERNARNMIAGDALDQLCGIPEQWIFDNGQDFLDRRISGKVKNFLRDSHREAGDGRPADTYITGLSDETGAKVRNARAYNARAKIVERYFADMSRDLDMLLPGYVGKDNTCRPARTEEMRQTHQRLVKGMSEGDLWSAEGRAMLARKTGYLLLEDFEIRLEEWIWMRAARTESRAKGLEHEGRIYPALELWKMLSGRRVLPSVATLERMSMGWTERLVSRGGEIRFAGNLYHAWELEQYGGRKVLIRFKKNDPSFVIVDQLAGEAPLAEPLRVGLKGMIAAVAPHEEIAVAMAEQKAGVKAAMERVRSIGGDPGGPSEVTAALDAMVADAKRRGGGQVSNVGGTRYVHLMETRPEARPAAAAAPDTREQDAAEMLQLWGKFDVEDAGEDAGAPGGFDVMRLWGAG